MAGNRKEMWKCAVCNKEASPKELIIDATFKSLLAQYPNDDKCIVHPDGSTSSMAAIPPRPILKPFANNTQKATGMISYDDDDNDDDIV